MRQPMTWTVVRGPGMENGDGTAGYDIGAYEAGAQMEYAIYLPLVIRNR